MWVQKVMFSDVLSLAAWRQCWDCQVLGHYPPRLEGQERMTLCHVTLSAKTGGARKNDSLSCVLRWFRSVSEMLVMSKQFGTFTNVCPLLPVCHIATQRKHPRRRGPKPYPA